MLIVEGRLHELPAEDGPERLGALLDAAEPAREGEEEAVRARIGRVAERLARLEPSAMKDQWAAVEEAANPRQARELRDQAERRLALRRKVRRGLQAKLPASKYRVERCVAEGVRTLVYTCEDLGLKRSVVVRAASEPTHNATFDRLVRRVAQLPTHPSIPTIYGAWLARDPHCCVMEHIDGPLLAEVMAPAPRAEGRSPWSLDEVLPLAVSVGEALRIAHGQGLEHNQVRPSKIRLDSHGRAVLIGQGTPRDAAYEQSFSTLNEHIGRRLAAEAYAFVAPEQLTGEKPDVGKTDQYQLGLLIYQMLTGRLPMRISLEDLGESSPDLQRLTPLAQHPRCFCPEALSAVVERMTHDDPSARYDSLDDALAEVRCVLPLHATLAKESLRRCTRGGEDAFYWSFYRSLLEPKPGADDDEMRQVFASAFEGQIEGTERWTAQYRKLNQAVWALIRYAERSYRNDDDDLPELAYTADHHAERIGIKAEWVQHFGRELIAHALTQDPLAEDEILHEKLRGAWTRTLAPGQRLFAGRVEAIKEEREKERARNPVDDEEVAEVIRTPEGELATLITSAFRLDELRQVVSTYDTLQVVETRVDWTSSKAEAAHDLVQLVAQHGDLRELLIPVLVHERQGRRAEIQAIAERLGPTL